MKQRLLRVLRSVASGVRKVVDLQDAHVYGGVGLVCVGVAQVYPPAAWVVAGAALFWLGVRS